MKDVENMPIQEMSTMEVPQNANTLFLATMERAVRVEEELKHQRELLIDFRADVNRRFEDIDKRFEDVNRRFEDMNKRFEDVNKRFDDMFKYLEMSREDSNKRFEDMNTRFDSVDKNVAFMIKFTGWFGGACVAGLTLLMTLYKFL